MEDTDMVDQTRQPCKAASPHPPDPPSQMPPLRPLTVTAPDHPREEPPNEKEVPLQTPGSVAQQQSPAATDAAATTTGTTTTDPTPTDNGAKKPKGSFSKLLDTVWKEANKEREAKKRGAAALMLALDNFEVNPGLDKNDQTARLEVDYLLKEVKELVAKRLRLNLAGTTPSQARTQPTHKAKSQQTDTQMTWAQKAASGKETATPAIPAKPTDTGKPQAKPLDTNVGNRYLATLYEDSKWRKVNTSVTRQRLNQVIFKGQDKVAKVTETRTGLAITLKDGTLDREMKERIGNFLSAAELEMESIWEKFVIPNIPATINTVENNKLVSRRTSLEDVRKEVQEAFGGTVKSMVWREYERDPTMKGLRVAVHKPEKIPRTMEILDISAVTAQRGDDAFSVIGIYNAGGSSVRPNEAVDMLTTIGTRLDNTLIMGDFNLHHQMWDDTITRNSSKAEQLVEWIERKRLICANDNGLSTHDGGGVLDLTLVAANIWNKVKRYQMAGALECGSDHSPQEISIIASHARGPTYSTRRLKDTDKETFIEACGTKARALVDTLPENWQNHDRSLESTAKEITRVLQDAFEATTPQKRVTGSGYKWWNESCHDKKRAATETGRTLRSLQWMLKAGATNLDTELDVARLQHAEAKKDLSRAIWKASKEFYQNLTANMTSQAAAHKAAKWLSRPQKTRSQAIIVDSVTHTDPQDKIRTLREAHLTGSGLPDLDRPEVQGDRGEAWQPLSKAEVESAIRKPLNTAPGNDGIQNKLLAMSWPALGNLITDLFNGCLRRGIHPTCFKEAKLIALPKPGKRDRSDPKSYRLISLLPTLGKALERAIAKRLTHEAMLKGLFCGNYACALPKRAASDLTLALVNEIKENMERGELTSILSFDIRGAFDGILPNRMVRRLQGQGWPGHVCKWVQSFLESRTSQITLDDTTEPPGNTSGSLPQGSPISPILYMLFMAPLYYSWSNYLRGYMDDGLWLIKGRTWENCIRDLRVVMEYTIGWCTDNGLQLDHKKSQLLHMTRKRTQDNPDLELTGAPVIKATPRNGSLKWLGVRFDRRLKFTAHVNEIAGRMEKSVNSLSILRGCRHGAPVKQLVQVVKSGIMATMTYAAATWWKPEQRGNKGKSKKLGKPLRRALLVALPAYCTTPTALIHMAANCPPAEITLDASVKREAVRWHSLDTAHPLYDLKDCKHQKEILRLLPKPLPRYGPLCVNPPPTSVPPDGAKTEGLQKEEAAESHLAWKARCPPTDIWLYTDGSKLENGWTGAGWWAESEGNCITEGGWSCGRWTEVADAEIRAIKHGLESLKQWHLTHSRTIWICTDNQAATTRMNSMQRKVGTSQFDVDRARQTAQNLRAQHPSLEVHCIWVPGHRGIEGNEKADALAKSAAVEVFEYTMSLARAKRWLREDLHQAHKAWFKDQKTVVHHATRKLLEFPHPDKLGVPEGPRKHQGKILAAISGHGDFAAYHRRMNHPDTRNHCHRCGSDKKETHEWTCRKNSKPWSHTFVQKLLLSSKGRTSLIGAIAKRSSPT
ncbi:RNA-directed DNA polymerase from mobile element jockey [Ceratocystis lukuohia]|uniref:RNA-directed DNA polymerase from mobile element jockey n=1 Tax=Ceratocystis lukuohia TaxID=2019550 RepID=A0ABR4MMX5_9PEZI